MPLSNAADPHSTHAHGSASAGAARSRNLMGGSFRWRAARSKVRRASLRWMLDPWRGLGGEMPPLEREDAARMARAELRWRQARTGPAEPVEAWIGRFALAVQAGLDEPCDCAPRPIGWGLALRLAASAVAFQALLPAAQRRGAGLEGERGAPIPGGPQYFNAGRLSDLAKVRSKLAGWRAGQAAKEPQASRRARWIQRCVGSLGEAGGGWAAVALRLARGAAAFAGAAIRAKQLPMERGRDLAQARGAAATAMQWLDAVGSFGSGGDEDGQWRCEWAGVSAQESERIESAAWIACAAARALPPGERSLAAACWFEAMARELSSPDGSGGRMASSWAKRPRQMMADMVEGARAASGGLASEMLAAGLELQGVERFFDGAGTQVGESRFGRSDAWMALDWEAYAGMAYGEAGAAARGPLIQGAAGSTAICFVAELLRRRTLHPSAAGAGSLHVESDASVGEAAAFLARNPAVASLDQLNETGGASALSGLDPGHFFRKMFACEREAMEIANGMARGGSEAAAPKARSRL